MKRGKPGTQVSLWALLVSRRKSMKEVFYLVQGLPQGRCWGTWAGIMEEHLPLPQCARLCSNRHSPVQSSQEPCAVGTVIIIISMLNIGEPRTRQIKCQAQDWSSKRESQEFNLGLLDLNYSLLYHLSWNCTSLQVGVFYLYFKVLSTSLTWSLGNDILLS